MRRLPEHPAAGVLEQTVRSEDGQVDVLVPVGVVVGDRCSDAVSGGVQPRTGGGVLEGAVPPVPVESGSGFRFGPLTRPAPAVHEEQVLIPIAVGVEEGNAAAHRLRQVLLAKGSALVHEVDPGGFGHLDEARLLRPCGSGSGEGERAERQMSPREPGPRTGRINRCQSDP